MTYHTYWVIDGYLIILLKANLIANARVWLMYLTSVCCLDYMCLLRPQDWWNSESYATYYRKWNVPIHDWLHAYLFQDLKPVSLLTPPPSL